MVEIGLDSFLSLKLVFITMVGLRKPRRYGSTRQSWAKHVKPLVLLATGSWTFAQLKRHMEVRYGRSKVYAQIQSELLAKHRKPAQSLHAYHDEIVAASYTANIL